LSLVNIKSIEHIVDVDSDDIYDYPFLYAVAAGHWRLSYSQAERLGKFFERGGYVPYWRAVRDDKGRIVAATWMNQDLGDGWEWADDPKYPEKLASLGFRFGVNYIVYTLTH
jgi:hypothetical protein